MLIEWFSSELLFDEVGDLAAAQEHGESQCLLFIGDVVPESQNDLANHPARREQNEDSDHPA